MDGDGVGIHGDGEEDEETATMEEWSAAERAMRNSRSNAGEVFTSGM